MSLDDLLTALYAVSGLAACACYGPQLRRLIRDAAARRAMSLPSWAGWLAVSLVGVAYGWIVAGRAEMVAVAAVNALCQAVVVALAVAQHRRDSHEKNGPDCSGPASLPSP